MNVNRISEFELSDDNGKEVTIKNIDADDRWHFIIDDESVFSFSGKDAEDLVSIFQEIGKL